jgi:N-acetylglutamate synthase-like GNAT family acetyltransferase
MTENHLFTIRPMTADDLGQALELSGDEGWNQTEKDWRLLLENPDNICIVAEKDKKVAGTATAMVHSGKIAWIGMVIVNKTIRGQGAGRMLLTHILEKLKHIESIKLDATPAGQSLYKSLGFIDEYKLFRMTNPSQSTFEYQPSEDIPERITSEVAEDIFTQDGKIFGTNRRYLLSILMEDYPEKAFFIKNSYMPDGYVLGRDGSRFNYIGPLCADSFESARSLLSKSLRCLIKKPVALDVPEEKGELINWLESLGFIKQRYFIRMYLIRNPYPGILKSLYLISGPEYG